MPELNGIGSLDLQRVPEAIEAGYLSANALLPGDFSRTEPNGYALWQSKRADDFAKPLDGRQPDGIQRQPHERPGHCQSAREWRWDSAGWTSPGRDLRRIYANGIFDRVEAEVVDNGGESASLEIRTREKDWGPNYLNFGAGIEDNFRGDSAYSFRLSYTATGQNPTGELRTTLELGQTPSLSTVFYQPIGYGTPWFAELGLEASRRKLRIFEESKVVAEYLVENSGIRFDVGRQLSTWGEFRIGLNRAEPDADLELGSPVLDPAGQEASVRTELLVDTLDSLGFPSTGAMLELGYVSSQQKLGADQDYETGSLVAVAPYSGRHGTLLSRLEIGRVLSEDSPPERAFTLGGFGRLSGYSPNELAGSELTLLSLVGYQPIESNLGLGQLYRGFSVEAGNVFLDDADDNFDNLLTGVSFFMGLESQLGPLYLSFGAAEGGRRSVSLTPGKALGE